MYGSGERLHAERQQRGHGAGGGDAVPGVLGEPERDRQLLTPPGAYVGGMSARRVSIFTEWSHGVFS